MNKLAAVALLCASAMPLAAQTKVLVVKNRISSSVTFDDARNFALPTACDEQGRSYVKLVKPGPGMAGPLLRLSGKGVLETEFDTSGAVVNVYAVRPNGGVAMVHLEGAAKVVNDSGPMGSVNRRCGLSVRRQPFFPRKLQYFARARC